MGVAVSVVSRRVQVIGPLATCRVRLEVSEAFLAR